MSKKMDRAKVVELVNYMLALLKDPTTRSAVEHKMDTTHHNQDAELAKAMLWVACMELAKTGALKNYNSVETSAAYLNIKHVLENCDGYVI